MSLVETIAAIAVTTNTTAMMWLMKQVYQLRIDITTSHTRTDEQIIGLILRVTRLERYHE